MPSSLANMLSKDPGKLALLALVHSRLLLITILVSDPSQQDPDFFARVAHGPWRPVSLGASHQLQAQSSTLRYGTYYRLRSYIGIACFGTCQLIDMMQTRRKSAHTSRRSHQRIWYRVERHRGTLPVRTAPDPRYPATVHRQQKIRERMLPLSCL